MNQLLLGIKNTLKGELGYIKIYFNTKLQYIYNLFKRPFKVESKSYLHEEQQREGKPHRVATQFRLTIELWGFQSPTKLHHNKKGKLMSHKKGSSFLRNRPSYFYLDEQD